MESESQPEPDSSRQAAFVPKAVERDLVRAALDYLRRSLPPDSGASGAPTVARQKADLCEWAKSLGLLLTPGKIVPPAWPWWPGTRYLPGWRAGFQSHPHRYFWPFRWHAWFAAQGFKKITHSGYCAEF